MLGKAIEKGGGGNQMGADEECQNSEQIRKISGEKNRSQESCSQDRKARDPGEGYREEMGSDGKEVGLKT